MLAGDEEDTASCKYADTRSTSVAHCAADPVWEGAGDVGRGVGRCRLTLHEQCGKAASRREVSFASTLIGRCWRAALRARRAASTHARGQIASIMAWLIRYGSAQATLGAVWAVAGSGYTSSAARPRAHEGFRRHERWLLGAGWMTCRARRGGSAHVRWLLDVGGRRGGHGELQVRGHAIN